jgi:hypothetical protein
LPPAGLDLTRPALAIKVENNPSVYPLSGLEDAELVYEEEVEGGITRFMAIFHCTDTAKAGPVRSARIVDPAIMSPTTQILADAGGNAIVREVLDKAHVVSIDETAAHDAMQRIPRTGIAFEHTLYGNTKALRKLGQKDYDKPPPHDLFLFGELAGNAKKAHHIEMHFSDVTTVGYAWNGKAWVRSDQGSPFTDESGKPITVDNVIIEQHTVNYAKGLRDVAGNQSVEIADVTGSGPAWVFRDGKVIKGKWKRKTKSSRVMYVDKAGDQIPLHTGTTWVELLPNKKGVVKGSFSWSKK